VLIHLKRKDELLSVLGKDVPESSLPLSLATGTVLMVGHEDEDYLELTVSEVNWVLPGPGLDGREPGGHILICNKEMPEDEEDQDTAQHDLEDYYALYGFSDTGWEPGEDCRKIVNLEYWKKEHGIGQKEDRDGSQ
jgi:hypothetical protein